MPSSDLCDNCNGDAGGITRIRMVIGTDRDDGSTVEFAQNFDHRVCWDCANAAASLDFGEFTRRHETRPRTMELP